MFYCSLIYDKLKYHVSFIYLIRFLFSFLLYYCIFMTYYPKMRIKMSEKLNFSKNNILQKKLFGITKTKKQVHFRGLAKKKKSILLLPNFSTLKRSILNSFKKCEIKILCQDIYFCSKLMRLYEIKIVHSHCINFKLHFNTPSFS